jgi:hypothetical protein
MSSDVETSAAQRWVAAQADHTKHSARLRELAGKALTEPLSMRETREQLELERWLANNEPILSRLEHAAGHERAAIDIELVVEQWAGLVESKREAYQEFANALGYLDEAFGLLLRVHGAQEAAVYGLPRVLAERLMFPDEASWLMRIASRLPHAMAWQGLLGGVMALTKGQLHEVMDADPGCTELSPRAIRNYLEEAR